MFVDKEFELRAGYGWQGGPFFRTRVKALQNGHERRAAMASRVRHRYSAPLQNFLEDRARDYVKGWFLAMNGMGNSFKIQDPSDYRATLESLGAAPAGTTPVQLRKISTFGIASYERIIDKPKGGTVTVYQNGVAKAGTLDTLTGLFTPSTSWTGGAALTWTGEFYVAVRFDSDELMMSIDNKSGGSFVMNGSVDLIEVFGE